MRNLTKLSFVLIVMVPVLCGCDVKSTAGWLDDKAGQILSAFGHEAGEEPDFKPENREDLTVETRQRIEEWLAEQGLNRFGDPPDTAYASGTPLIDKETGKALERFQYILDKHPDLLDKIREY